MATSIEYGESTTRFTVDAVASELSVVRNTVTQTLRSAGASPEVIDDVELAISEAATNVIDHTTSASISIAVGPCAAGWAFDVADAETIPDLTASSGPLPNADDVGGRGLFIVQALMDRVEVIDVGPARVMRCTKFAF